MNYFANKKRCTSKLMLDAVDSRPVAVAVVSWVRF